MRECYGCGGRADECELPLRKPRGRRLLCTDCRERFVHGLFANRKVYVRATLVRHYQRRQTAKQGDLLDPVMGPP